MADQADSSTPGKYAELLELLGGYRPVLETFHTESDRGAILVAASQLDVCLQELLTLVTVDEPEAHKVTARLFKGDGPLCTFSEKISVAHCFGLISHETAAHLHRIREIRNQCAHSPDAVDFSTSKIRDLTDAMWEVDFLVPADIRAAGGAQLTRGRFLMNAAFMLLRLRMTMRLCRRLPRRELWMLEAIGALHISGLQDEIDRKQGEIDRNQAELKRKEAEWNAAFEQSLASYADTAGITVEEAREQLAQLEHAEAQAVSVGDRDVDESEHDT